MRMKKRVCAAIALFTLSVAGAQAAKYQITDLGDFNPLSINDKGWVAGAAGEGTAKQYAMLFAGRLRYVLSGGIARAVNDVGQIAGTYTYQYRDQNNKLVDEPRAFRHLDTTQGPKTKYLVENSNHSEGLQHQ